MFYSIGVAFGGSIVLSSYNKFHNNFLRDAITVALVNSATSVFAGFAIFSVTGFLAHETGRAVGDVVSSGTSLVFIAYPEAMARMPLSPMWAILFFLMLVTLA